MRLLLQSGEYMPDADHVNRAIERKRGWGEGMGPNAGLVRQEADLRYVCVVTSKIIPCQHLKD